MNLKNYNDEELRVILRFLKDQEQDRKKMSSKIIKLIFTLAVIGAGYAVGVAILNHTP
jgi:hypothetical protein